jgi:flavin reductase (DIM6/NTAB) family NADH-FMN oxidoreductase RutF
MHAQESLTMLKTLPLEKVYQYIEPGPVVLLTTAPPRAKPNIMAMSWHMMMEFEPPCIGCVVSEGNYSFAALKKTKQCVIAVPDLALAETAIAIGNTTGKDIDKFDEFGLTAAPASMVKAPLIAECFVNLECRVIDTRFVNRYNMFVLECVAAWIDPAKPEAKTIHHVGYGKFHVDGEAIKLKSKMR